MRVRRFQWTKIFNANNQELTQKLLLTTQNIYECKL